MPKSVLLVDDDVCILETAQDILEAEDIRVLTAGDAREALAQLTKEPFLQVDGPLVG